MSISDDSLDGNADRTPQNHQAFPVSTAKLTSPPVNQRRPRPKAVLKPADVLASQAPHIKGSLDLDPSRSRSHKRNAGLVGSSDGPTPEFLKPKQVYCHLCAREFGTKSIEIHIKSCARKFQRTARVKAPAKPDPQEYPLPRSQGASEQAFYEYNLAALRIFGEVTGDFSYLERVKGKEDERRRAEEDARRLAEEEARRRAEDE
eukprot:CAMPEP_0185753076 /NCGR_PEP_ID=MMETSP1174-20130828/11824_1 /TAXON_ID=35687 /ORGANISM="Dictyocha speculum, Strain CCMP1381" /LENGTH=203 /DNA_ID=CAMNT_0028430773 /DNA_START=37 /DNA_END=645 /DNA_ORIENTATION=+